ncbi:MAG TPA: HU family DNA-binding protein [Thermoanaerobaculia bacterium]|nr:HU family DNA-binding protein [Thermoanaerobaculia bacterium]
MAVKKAPAKAAAAKAAPKKAAAAIKDAYTKAQLFAAVAEETGLTKKDVAAVFDSLGDIVGRHLKSRGAGTFTLPGLLKIRVVKRAATKAKKGTNPFTGKEMLIAAKPARRAVRIRPLKALRELAE